MCCCGEKEGKRRGMFRCIILSKESFDFTNLVHERMSSIACGRRRRRHSSSRALFLSAS